MGKLLGFTPVHTASLPDSEIVYEPKGQDHLKVGERLAYVLRPPSKRVLEMVQNQELDIMLDGMGADDDGEGGHKARLNSGTARRLFVVNCLKEWRNLYVKTGDDADGSPLWDEVRFEIPHGQPGTAAFNDAMARNYERVPDIHALEMVKLLKARATVKDAAEIEKN